MSPTTYGKHGIRVKIGTEDLTGQVKTFQVNTEDIPLNAAASASALQKIARAGKHINPPKQVAGQIVFRPSTDEWFRIIEAMDLKSLPFYLDPMSTWADAPKQPKLGINLSTIDSVKIYFLELFWRSYQTKKRIQRYALFAWSAVFVALGLICLWAFGIQ